jgi:colicin import membrane protein
MVAAGLRGAAVFEDGTISMSAQLSMPEPETTALAVIPASAVSTIVAADNCDILGKLAAKVAAFKPDASTDPGRKAIRSFVHGLRGDKASLLRLGKGLKEDAIKTQRSVNAEERIIEERMDAYIERLMAPVTEFEAIDKRRVSDHEGALRDLQCLAVFAAEPDSDAIAARMAILREWDARAWQEFKDRATDYAETALHTLNAMHAAALKREDEAAELARLRAEAEERARLDAIRQQAEHEARIAKEAAERATREAEARAERERLDTLRAAAEERTRVELEAQRERQRIKAEADAAAQRAEDARLAAEMDRVAAEQRATRLEEQARQAEADRIAAEQKRVADAAALARRVEADRVAAAARAETEQRLAVEAERQRAEDERAAEEAEAQRRADNRAIAEKVNREVLASLMKAVPGLNEGAAADVVKAIARGLIHHTKIEY